MLKNKRIIFIILVAIALFLTPTVCNAAAITATQTTPTSTGETVKWSYELNEEGNIIKLLCINKDSVAGNVEIPNTIDGKTVTQISTNNKGIFEDCLGITGVTIPNSVKSIGYSSFAGCKALKSVTIPNSVITIGRYAFEECLALTEITIPDSVITIEEYAFNKCNGLSKVTLSKNLTVLNEGVFAYCKGLTSIIIPASVSTICGDSYDGAFYWCSNLEKVLIPDSVAAIEENVFQHCDKLTIYGNDGQASKTYAETQGYKFDYMANWGKGTSGSDIAAPIIESLYVKYSSVMEYWDTNTNTYRVPTNGQIIICLEFNEDIAGKTAPELTIKFGVGNNIKLNSGVINGKSVTYNYTVKSTDEGLISCVSLNGGDITDLAGNKAEITSTKITTQYQSGSNIVYANGSSVPTDNNNGQGNQQTVALSSIVITKAPTKTSYKVGETFDKAGMVVTATYSDGSKKEITNYTISPSVALKLTDKKVVITYNEKGVTKSVEQKITVTAKTTNDTDNKGNNSSKDDTIKDSTIKGDNKLPQTGATVISLVAIILLAAALISKVRYGKLKDI